MKFSENWLREHVRTDATREQLAATLTAIGLEVEHVVALGDGLEHVVVGQIVSAERHPEADRLQVCRVDAGTGESLQIVCGAPNARAGLKAPLAMVGARVGTLTIKAAKLRGVESSGMLCSAKELGLDADASGLLELPADAPVGAPLADALGLPDATFELKLTPNRADCFGIRGIAFDVAAATGSTVESAAAEPVAAGSDATLAVELHAGAAAPRYVGRVIQGVDATVPTPAWMAERLRRSGVRPVSLLVDVTQYVMLATGQPMHAFDRALLRGPVGVRFAREGETLVLLDGREVALDPGFLAITDADRPVALAGIMGGMDTRVTDATRDVFLEAAHFAPEAIIGRGRRLGLHTDAGHRFERGVDPELPREAIEIATRLVLDMAGGKPGPVVEAVVEGALPAREKLKWCIDRLTEATIGNDGWHARLFARELLAPSSNLQVLYQEDLEPKFAFIRRVIGEVTGIPESDPALLRCMISIAAPCLMLLVAGNGGLPGPPQQVLRMPRQELTAHLHKFALAGLEAIGREYAESTPKGRKSPSKRRKASET